MSAAEYALDLTESIETEHEESEFLFEMANLRQSDTGLPMIIWVSERGRAKHGPRIKVSRTHSHKADIDNSVGISISDVPQIITGFGLDSSDFLLVKNYILLNKETILDYWNGEIGTHELVKRLRKIW